MMNWASDALACDAGGRLRRPTAPTLSPTALGLGITIAWVAFVVIAHTLATQTMGPERVPFGPARFAWTMLVNAALLGLVAAGHASLKKGVAEDLRALRPILPTNGEPLERLEHRVANLSPPARLTATITGLAGGLAVATLDPTLRDLYRHLPLFDPRYLAFITQNLLFATLVVRLFATEVHMTRAYAQLGEQVKVDLLDPSTLLVFGRKGLRSVILWVSISTLFSMFWVLDSAGQANIALAVAVLGVATAALVAPTSGARRNIAGAKAAELAIVSQAIRKERDLALSPRQAEAPPDDARLGNLIQYQGFVKAVREWPFDLSIVSRSSLFIVLGAGSWFGGAVVERLLSQLLD